MALAIWRHLVEKCGRELVYDFRVLMLSLLSTVFMYLIEN